MPAKCSARAPAQASSAPRWSRTEESYGEDRYLTARIGEAYVRGTGSGDLSQPRHALSTLKHFIAYGASEGGQNGGSNLLGERELRETYKTIGGVPFPDNQYTVYGEVVEGLDVVDAIQQVKTNKQDRPTENVVIKSVEVLE